MGRERVDITTRLPGGGLRSFVHAWAMLALTNHSHLPACRLDAACSAVTACHTLFLDWRTDGILA